MKFKFHLFVQKHANQTFTVTVLPFYDLTSYGANLSEIKADLAEAVIERVQNIPPFHLQHLAFDPHLSLQRVEVQLRPIDRKSRKRRRERVRLTFSVLVSAEEDGQLLVTVPRLGPPPLTFYVFNQDELQQVAAVELASWFDSAPLEQLVEYRGTHREYLDVLEVDVPIKKPGKQAANAPEGASRNPFWALREVGLNISAQAAEGRLRKTYRRNDAVEGILKILSAPRNNSVLIVGTSESGKTAVIHEVVRRIQQSDCPEGLQGREVWLLTPDRLIAGAQFVGTWEERIANIATECRQKRHILYVDDLPGLLEVGRWSKSDTNIGMALRPYVAAGEVILIGESSPERLTLGRSLGASFINLFHPIPIDAMPEDESLTVLTSVARDLEREFDLRIDPGALDAALELTRRFLPYRALPGKAIRLVEDAVSHLSRTAAGQVESNPPPPAGGGLLRRIRSVTRPVVDRQCVLSVFARQTGLPEFIVNDETRLDIQTVERYFKERLIGQDEAVETMVNTIAMVKAGLNDPHKPLGTFLFIGPTGVGKTEMAKTLAAYLFGDPARLIRFDMSEYGSLDGVNRLIGAFNTEGELTRRVREQPFCVVLLDEFEKADPRVYDIFLQVLGEGRLTDAHGRTTYFHNAILVMTSNLGSGQRQLRQVGFGARREEDHEKMGEIMESHFRAHVESHFRPEFVNRIDRIVAFRHLTPEALRLIARRELGEVLRRDGITRRLLPVEIDDSVIDLVLVNGYSPVYGARPLKREIERLIVAPLAYTLAQRAGNEKHLLRVVTEGQQVIIKAIAISEADQVEPVTLASGIHGTIAEQRKMDIRALIEGLAALRRKLSDWQASTSVAQMHYEKAQLLHDTHRSDFWRNSQETREALSRFYLIDRLLQRLANLLERAEYLEEFGVMVQRERALGYQADLARDYEDLFAQVSYLDIELRTAHLPHRNQAMLLISPFGMQASSAGAPDDGWLRRLAVMYLNWAERKGYAFDLFALQPAPKSPGELAFTSVDAGNFEDVLSRFAALPRSSEIALFVRGSNVFGFLKGERGLHRLAGRDGGIDELALVRVYAIPDSVDTGDWLQNYQTIKAEIAAGRRPEPAQGKQTVIRLYSLERAEKFIRDLRTGMRLFNVKDVMVKGLLDDLILAYLQTDEPNLTWEDRFPPTFPY